MSDEVDLSSMMRYDDILVAVAGLTAGVVERQRVHTHWGAGSVVAAGVWC